VIVAASSPDNIVRCSRNGRASVRNSIVAEQLGDCSYHDLEIEHHRPTLQVFSIEFYFFCNGKLVAPIDLSPAGDSRPESVDPGLTAQVNKIVLIEQGRTRADETHVADQDTPELWNFVETGAAQEPADRRKDCLWIRHKMRCQRGRARSHRSKLGHAKEPSDQ
jgi:hypothetical protein